MLDCKQVYEFLSAQGVSFFTGVPDSLLKEMCACISELAPAENHLIAANEGGAVALAAGHFLATGEAALVYMQNSGLGNAVNPLISLADREVYGIPMVLLIGWRGEPGVKDEPQHLKQGKISRELLSVMGIPHEILPDSMDAAKACFEKAFATARKDKAPFAILVKSGAFAPYAAKAAGGMKSDLTREGALEAVLALMDPRSVVVSTTGVTSRELFELREKSSEGHGRDFLTVGSMGHASQIALGLARGAKGRTVYCVDGDGAALMHLGALAIVGTAGPANLKHLLFNNGAHESVGGQPTAGAAIDFPAIAKSCGYKACWTVGGKEELETKFREFSAAPGPVFLEVRIKKGARKDLGRPTTTPRENKDALMEFLGS